MTDPQPLCRNCRWWKPWHPHDTIAHCMRHAPTIPQGYQDDGMNRYAQWPRTEGTDFCGDFEPRKKGEKG